MKETKTLFRPVNQKELDLIEASDYSKFPPRLPQQPIFYPVINLEYARKITQEWNVPAYGKGYVLKFSIEASYISQFEIQNVGGEGIDELWIPAEQLEEFNSHIIGKIEVIESYPS
jgi:hypothetical protein